VSSLWQVEPQFDIECFSVSQTKEGVMKTVTLLVSILAVLILLSVLSLTDVSNFN